MNQDVLLFQDALLCPRHGRGRDGTGSSLRDEPIHFHSSSGGDNRNNNNDLQEQTMNQDAFLRPGHGRGRGDKPVTSVDGLAVVATLSVSSRGVVEARSQVKT